MTSEICESLVMIVEDDLDVRESIAEVLEDHAYVPLTAANGREAIDQLRGRNDRPCVILLDIMMPEMDGRQFRAVQRQDPELMKIPVVVLTAHANIHETTQELGAEACLKKPVQLQALLDLVDRFCRNDAAAASA